MTNPTPHGQEPEALRLADEFRECLEWDTIPSIIDIEDAADELRRMHAENEALRAQQDDAYDHGPQAETVEEAARDVGKWLNERPNRPLDLRHVAMLTHHAIRTPHVQTPAEIEHVAGDVSKNGAELNTSTQQPAPAAQQEGATKEHVRLVRVIADKIEDGTLFRSGIYSNKDLARFVRNVADAAAPQFPTPQTDSQPTADEATAMNRTRELAESGRWPSDWVDAYRRGYSDRAARAPADGALEDALRERDEADDFIDTLLDDVLGADRAEWSSAYGRADALEEVRERITALHKPAVDRAWTQFAAAEGLPEDAALPGHVHEHG